jgi:ethanolamine utilization microcompartment shell protein EutS
MKYIAGFLSALIISGTVTAVERSLVPAVTSIISHTIEEMTNSA